jgi:pyruvate dehydrogenase E2 component (dihydrolipoamide acetyltransferase)
VATQILMPALSPTMEEGKLAKWLVKEGDEVHSGDILAEIETDKATMEFEAVDEGRIGKILVPEGTEGVKVNQPIAELISEDDDAAPLDISSAMQTIKAAVSAETREKIPPSHSLQATPATNALPRKGGGERIFASPLAKRIAALRNVDLSTLHGSGPRGRIVKADLEGAKPGARPAPQIPQTGAPVTGIAPLPDARLFYKPGDYDEIPHDFMRRTIAKRLTSAKALVPNFYLTIDCRIDELLASRARLNEKSEGSYKLSVNDFIVKAVALALMRVPEVNSSWTDTAIIRHHHADVGVAVALDFGLITPIVFHAEEKGLVSISHEIKELAERARAKKLKPSEFEGGSFAVSNLGMFGIREFTAVINPPHAAILAVGAGEERAIVRNGMVEAATVMTVTMACDHRVIDGATGARFLQVFKTFIEEPAAMLL